MLLVDPTEIDHTTLSLTMHFLPSTIFIGLASAASHSILVGKDGDSFSPDSVIAAVGDTLVFKFYPGNHNVIQGNYNKPCHPLDSAFYSGFVSTESGPASNTFSVKVNSTDPIWIYCSQGEHCQSGMAAVINPPFGSFTDAQSLSDYKSAAASVSSSSHPDAISGGRFSDANSPDDSSSSSAAAASSTAKHTSTKHTSFSTMSHSATGAAATSAAAATGTSASGSSTPTGSSGSAVPTGAAPGLDMGSSWGITAAVMAVAARLFL